MKKALIIFLALLGVAIAAATLRSPERSAVNKGQQGSGSQRASTGPTERVPAHYEDAASAGKLAPTLPPEQFFGKARTAYQIAREIPETLAQLPCYCYCDEGHGHKSLHSCYETDHSSMCAICIDEALMAYRLQKDEGLTPAQIRERIVARYSAMH
jgi:hypothetical protein